MEDENKELDQNLKDQNGNQNHDDDQEDLDRDDQDQNDDDQDNDDGEGEETIESLKAKLQKTQQAYENQKIRAEKAEKKNSEDGKNNNKKVAEPQKKNSKPDELSPKDLYALMEKKVPKEDIDDVVNYARFSKISVESALDTDFVTRLLADKAEKRTTARATNIGNSRRGTGRPSGQSLLNNAIEKGEIPDDDADLERMIDARIEQKRAKISNKK